MDFVFWQTMSFQFFLKERNVAEKNNSYLIGWLLYASVLRQGARWCQLRGPLKLEVGATGTKWCRIKKDFVCQSLFCRFVFVSSDTISGRCSKAKWKQACSFGFAS